LLLLVAGFTGWAAALLSLYGVNAIACAFAWQHSLHRAVLLSLLALHLTALGSLSVHCWRRWRSPNGTRPATFIEYLGLATTIAAVGATAFTLAPSLILSLCV